MKSKLFFTLILFVLLSFSAKCQQVIKSYYFQYSGFDTPLILDSLDNQGKKFSFEDYFPTPKSDIPCRECIEETDEDGFLNVEIHPCGAVKYNICTYRFELNLQSSKKIRFEFFSNAVTKISIDGENVAEIKNDAIGISTDTKTETERQLEPGKHTVAVSMMCEYGKKTSDGKEYKYALKTIVHSDNSEEDFQQSGLTLKAMLCGENPYSVSISNSGKYYMAKYYNTDNKGKNTYRAEVRTTEDDDKIIFSDNKITSYHWLDTEDWLYYMENSKLYILNPVSGERKILKENLENEGNITFTDKIHIDSDEPYFPFIVSKSVKKDNTKDDLHRMYLPDDRIPGWRDRNILFAYGQYPLFHTYRSVYLNDVNVGKQKILISISKDDITKRPFSFNSIYQYDLQERTLDTLVQNDGFTISAQYLKDGNKIVILASNEAFNSIGSCLKKNQIPNAFNQSIYIMNLKTKEITPVGKDFNPSVQKIVVRKNNLYLTCQDKDSVNIYRYNLKDGTYSLLDLNVDIVHNFDISDDETKIVYYGENYNKPKRVFRAGFDAINNKVIKIKEVYFPKQKEFAQIKPGKMEKWTFRKNNFDIDGRIYYPEDFDSLKQYPMIVYYYGGCEPTDRSFEMRYSAWLYTQQGYIVYVINPSGTVGYGQEFAARHVNAWGDYTAEEIIEGVKTLCKQKSFIDKKHIGCIGASYGGFMTQTLITKTDIFACAISHAGISNIASYWGEGYWGYSYSGAATSDNYPWNNPKLYTDHSPLFSADKINTPLLLLHGTSDTNVPIGESIQMYNALKILGKEVEFITVAGENHGIVDFDKRIKWNNTIYAWFAKWLKNDNSWWNSMYPEEQY